MKTSIQVLWALTALVALTALSTAAASGVDATKCGVVDMDRVAAEYREMRELDQQFQDFQRDLDRQLQEKHKTRVLTDAERQEYLDKSAMGAPTEATAERLKELEELSDQRERRLLELRDKNNCTEQEAAELAEIEKLYDERMRELASLQAELQARRREKFEELTSLLEERLKEAVKAVAAEQELTIVLRKHAVLLGGVEITDAVLEKLNQESES